MVILFGQVFLLDRRNGDSLMDNTVKMSILYDYYGKLLTERQSKIFTLYHEDNLSLSEIGDELKVSKQGVHDALKKAEASLKDFEKKLCLIKNSTENERLLKETDELIKAIMRDIEIDSHNKSDVDTIKRIEKIEKNINKLII